MNCTIAVLPYDLRHEKNLAAIKVADLYAPFKSSSIDDTSTIADLRQNDHLIVYCCSSTLFKNYKGLRCRISLMIAEPASVQFRYYVLIPFFWKKFYKILTFSDVLLNLLPNSIFHVGFEKTELPVPPLRKNSILSIIASAKNKLPGHKLRHAFIRRCKEIQLKIDVYGRGYKILDGKEGGLSEYMFSVTIENCKQVNYFTEKIIDCFLLKTVPVYWGAPNIGTFFESGGIICCDSLSDLVEECKNLSKEKYLRMTEAIEANHAIAKSLPSASLGAALKIKYSARVSED